MDGREARYLGYKAELMAHDLLLELGFKPIFWTRSIARNPWRNYVGGSKSIINGDGLILFRRGRIDSPFLEKKRKEQGRGRYVLHDPRIVKLYEEFKNELFQFDYICIKYNEFWAIDVTIGRKKILDKERLDRWWIKAIRTAILFLLLEPPSKVYPILKEIKPDLKKKTLNLTQNDIKKVQDRNYFESFLHQI